MQGVIIIYKEKGYTSFHAVAVMRHLTGERKIGHTGTLDPDVSGVLPICIGKATRLVGLLTDTDKTYRCVMQLGSRTDTQDMSGSVLERMDADEIRSKLGPADEAGIPALISGAFEKFTGEIEQLPPMYSAVKVGGVKLVDAARKGKVLERPVKHVTVYGYSGIAFDPELLRISFQVDCSKGTYVRTICEDIGTFIGIPSCMYELERVRAAGFGIEDTITLDEAARLAGEGKLEDVIIPADEFLLEYDYLIVRDDSVRRLIYGNYLYQEDIDDSVPPCCSGDHAACGQEGIFRIYDSRGQFYALYRFDTDDNCYKCEKMFI